MITCICVLDIYLYLIKSSFDEGSTPYDLNISTGSMEEENILGKPLIDE